MKVLFLDFDGVMNSEDYIKSLGKPFSTTVDDEIIDPKTITLLNTIIRETKSEIVVSSVWRKTMTAFALQCMMLRHGFEGEIIDTTPSSASGIRGLEIQTWLNQHPEVESFAILDDSNDMAHLMPYLIRTTYKEGLTDYYAQQTIKMLSNETC